MMNRQKIAAICAFSAAALYAVNIPFAKIILRSVEPTMTAALLYLGAGIGLLIYRRTGKISKKEQPFITRDYPYLLAMILLDIAAPILLMYGIERTCAANVSLLNNFEIVVTTIIAWVFFKEKITPNLIAAVILITAAGGILCIEGTNGLEWNSGSPFVLAATICWGVENNCTKELSKYSSAKIVTIKGCFSGLGSFCIALAAGESIPAPSWFIIVPLLGFLTYGLSINLYIKAQKYLGAAKTAAFYGTTPFFGVLFSILFLHEKPAFQFYPGLLLMVTATIFLLKDATPNKQQHQRKTN